MAQRTSVLVYLCAIKCFVGQQVKLFEINKYPCDNIFNNLS